MRRRVALGILAVLVVAGPLVAFVGGRVPAGPGSGEAAADTISVPAAAVRTALPGVESATGEPTLASLPNVRLVPGGVVQAAGPFDDRFVFEGLTYDGARVHGSLRVTSDVSALLNLEVLAGFFDGQGRLLATARHVAHPQGGAGDAHAHAEDGTGHRESFAIAVPPSASALALSAAIGVPVLVNE